MSVHHNTEQACKSNFEPIFKYNTKSGVERELLHLRLGIKFAIIPLEFRICIYK